MGIFQKVPKKYLVGNDWANGFKTHNELTMYPLGKYPLAPSVRETEGLFDYVDGAAKQSPGDGNVEPSVAKFSDIWAAGGSLRRSPFVST
jgi:hypothetical protein